MPSTSDAILEKLRDAKVLPEDTARWERILPYLGPEAQEGIFRFITEVPDGLQFANNDLKGKDLALDTMDEKRWQQIQEWEKKYLKSLKSNLPL